MSKYEDFDLNINKVKIGTKTVQARSDTEIICEGVSMIVESMVESEAETCATCVTMPSRGCDYSDMTNCC